MADLVSDGLEFLTNIGFNDEKLFADLLDVGLKSDDYLTLNGDVNWFETDLVNADENEEKHTVIKQESCDANEFVTNSLPNVVQSEEVLIDDSAIDNVIEVDSSHGDLLEYRDDVISSVLLDTDSEGGIIDDALSLSPDPVSIEVHHNYCSAKDVSPSSSAASSPNSRKNVHNRGSRSKAITDISLTEEEIRLLSKEGYQNFPTGNTPLTKQEERVLRKIRRKIRNKKSAQCSRQRKKEYLDDLEKKFEKCSNDNLNLRKENLRLKKTNETLLIKLKRLLLLSGISNGQTSFKTSFFVLILSFLLIIFPYFSPEYFDEKYNSLANNAEKIGTGRHLLTIISSNDFELDNGYAMHTNDANDSFKTVFNYSESYI